MDRGDDNGQDGDWFKNIFFLIALKILCHSPTGYHSVRDHYISMTTLWLSLFVENISQFTFTFYLGFFFNITDFILSSHIYKNRITCKLGYNMGTKVEAAISHFKERRQSSLHGTLDFFSPDFFFKDNFLEQL